MNAIFERFIKLDEFKQGVGLGLPICKVIIDRLGGDIWAKSDTNKGTVFSFTIPYIPADTQKNPDQGIVLNGSECIETKDKKTILVAEDTFSNYKLFETYLKYKYNLVHVLDGTEVLASFKQHNPDIVLMDIKMPKMNGYEALKEIRTIDQVTPVIAVTAFAFKEDEEEVRKAGFAGFLPKPVKRDYMINLIDKLLYQS